MGLVNRVLPTTELESGVADLAATIAGNAPLTVAAAKRCVAEYVRDPKDRDLAGCQALVDACFGSEDYKEGRRAFMEKRPPAFQGRYSRRRRELSALSPVPRPGVTLKGRTRHGQSA